MSIYRGAGGSGDAVNDASSEAILTVQAKDAAIAAQVAAQASATSAANSATSAASSASGASTSASAASSSASAASTSATNASNSASAASTSATNAAASASTATTQATNASTSASNASTSATNASNSATAASTSASNASTSATNSSNSATAAASSATSAAASYDSFDDRYLGSKSSAPSVDNDGNTLLTGALYFNTVDNSMKVWSGSVWLDAYASLSGAVTAVSGTAPIASSGGTTPAISITQATTSTDGYLSSTDWNTFNNKQAALSAGYGDTTNPYASKTANHVLAAPDGSSGSPTFRALVAADVPTLNQNTTGSAATLTTARTIGITGDLAYTSPSFNGSADVTAAATLATVNSNTGSFGSSSSIPVITVNAKGLVTAVSTSAVAGGQYFGTAAVKAIAYNADTISENITVSENALSVGSITISSGFSVTVNSGKRWVIL
jgi:hypothetical protein